MTNSCLWKDLKLFDCARAARTEEVAGVQPLGGSQVAVAENAMENTRESGGGRLTGFYNIRS